jgi:hypothetical protein
MIALRGDERAGEPTRSGGRTIQSEWLRPEPYEVDLGQTQKESPDAF